MTRYEDLAQACAQLGQTLGVSEWILVDQARIDRFAQATDDHQWIHVDPERAATGPFGTPIAHGFLTLSLLPVMLASAIQIAGLRMTINYGVNRLRFPAPVPAGSRVRARFVLQRVEPIDGGVQVVLEAAIEREGGDKPVCVVEPVLRWFT